MKNLKLENLGLVDLNDTEMKETTGGALFSILFLIAFVVLAAIWANDNNPRTEVIVS